MNKDDVYDIIKFAEESYDNGEKPVLLRFAKTDYYASNARFDYAEEDSFDMSDVDGYVAQETVFLDFDILSMGFTSEDGYTKTVVGVVADSIDIINGLTAPEDIMPEEQDWWQKIMAGIMLIIIIALVMFFSGPLKFVFDIVWTGIKFLLSIVVTILTFPFKVIGWLLKPK